ncbi:MAG: alpha/beta-type small acid-soluble spore protein [Peptococcaceae bacterium]|jgi:small acid-soluble spore protein F (minor alpha/beta-type SASP)|nr:alpha/beta-type small acid-soluble spore protein [Peptococcaceae bacterium]
MSRKRKSMMSENLKQQLAQELGFSDALQQEGFAAVSSRDCGNMVRLAIQKAEQQLNSGKNLR